MSDTPEARDRDLLANVLFPVVNETDAAKTATALAPYGPAHVTALHCGMSRRKTPFQGGEDVNALPVVEED